MILDVANLHYNNSVLRFYKGIADTVPLSYTKDSGIINNISIIAEKGLSLDNKSKNLEWDGSGEVKSGEITITYYNLESTRATYKSPFSTVRKLSPHSKNQNAHTKPRAIIHIRQQMLIVLLLLAAIKE